MVCYWCLLFASNIGSEHLVGSQKVVLKKDYWSQEILAAFMLLILGWVFVPFYKASGVTTMPEFLEKDFHRLLECIYL